MTGLAYEIRSWAVPVPGPGPYLSGIENPASTFSALFFTSGPSSRTPFRRFRRDPVFYMAKRRTLDMT